MGTWVVSTFWLPGIMLLWTRVYLSHLACVCSVNLRGPGGFWVSVLAGGLRAGTLRNGRWAQEPGWWAQGQNRGPGASPRHGSLPAAHTSTWSHTSELGDRWGIRVAWSHLLGFGLLQGLQSGSWVTSTPSHIHTHRLDCSALPHEEILGHWGSKPKNYWRRWSQNWDRKTVSLKTQHECKLNTENVQNRPIHRHRKLIFYYLLPKGRTVSDGKQTQRFFLGWWKCAKLRLWGWLYNSVNILKFTKFYTQNRWILYVNCISIRFF